MKKSYKDRLDVGLQSPIVRALLVALPVLAVLWLGMNELEWPGPLRGVDAIHIWSGLHLYDAGKQNVYLAGTGFFYPPQFLAWLAPLGLLSGAQAIDVFQGISVAGLALVAGLWVREKGHGSIWILLTLGFSFAGVELVYYGQFATVIGLASLSGALFCARDEKWLLAGLLIGLGSIRLSNALPIGLALLIFAARKHGLRAVLGYVGGILAALVPATVIVTVLYPAAWSQWLVSLKDYLPFGLQQMFLSHYGLIGTLLCIGVATIVCTIVLSKQLTLDRCAAALVVSALFAPFPSSYAAVFCWPALARLGRGNPSVMALLTTIPWAVYAVVTHGGGSIEMPTALADMAVGVIAMVLVLRKSPAEVGTGLQQRKQGNVLAQLVT